VTAVRGKVLVVLTLAKPRREVFTAEPGRLATSGFRGRIDRRLSVLLGILFALVLLVGGASLFLLGSLLLETEPIARQSEQVHVVERVHTTLQRLLSAIHLAHVRGAPIPEGVRAAYATQLESLVTLYGAGGGAREDVQEMRQIVADAGAMAERVGTPAADPTPPARTAPDADTRRPSGVRSGSPVKR
jgi:hypothetical protein